MRKKFSCQEFLEGVFPTCSVERIGMSAFEITFQPDCGCCRSQLDLIRYHGFQIATIRPPAFRVTFEKSGHYVYVDV